MISESLTALVNSLTDWATWLSSRRHTMKQTTQLKLLENVTMYIVWKTFYRLPYFNTEQIRTLTSHIRSHFCHCHCKRNDKEVPRLKICIHSSLLIKAISGADRSSLDPRMCNVQPSAAIANWDRWINVKLIEFRMQFSSSLKGFSAQKIYFASNLIFWVGMGWGTGHLAQNNHNKLVQGTW